MSDPLRSFIEIPYAELEERNLAAKDQRRRHVPAEQIREERLKYLADEKHIKAVTVLFSDLEGRLHMLDYDKKFIIKSDDNLTFDGSSIRGFTAQRERDLRLGIDCRGTGSAADRRASATAEAGQGRLDVLGQRRPSPEGQARTRSAHRRLLSGCGGEGVGRDPV